VWTGTWRRAEVGKSGRPASALGEGMETVLIAVTEKVLAALNL
jgi:hypothetical protein